MVSGPNNRDREARVLRVFEDASNRPASEREEFLAKTCGTDVEMRRRIERLLQLSTEPDPLAARPSLPPVTEFLEDEPEPPREGTRIGSYRLCRVLASGGMGTVYEAEQDHPQRLVALKVLRVGLRSPSAVRRFSYESELLGRLHHPGIAQVYESGMHTDANGLSVPWFALEYVKGARGFVEYVSKGMLAVQHLLPLFIEVCEAVQHGHQNGIIHRDLKPSNLLIDQAGKPKVIDFGVARSIAQDPSGSMHTRAGHVIGTLAYMSPEQASGDPGNVDIRTDVYSLGAVLFESLTGRPPLKLDGCSVLEAVRRISGEEPPRPSSLVKSLPQELWIGFS